MEASELKKGTEYNYRTHKTEGTMTFVALEYAANGQTWAAGVDKKKDNKRVCVYPSQLKARRGS